MKKVFRLVFIFMSVCPSITFSVQGNTVSKTVNCIPTNEKITIDGILSEKTWQRAGFSEFTQQDPDQGQNPTQRSEAWFAYDEHNLYFAARFHDTYPDSVLARLVRRDFVWGDPSDGAVLYLDTYRDKRNGYFFYVSAAGTLADGLLENDNKQTDLSWDAVWEGVPHFDSGGWSVEMRIPFSQLRFHDQDLQEWGFNVERYYSRRGETDMVAYTPRNENGFTSRFPALTGIKGIRPSTKLELLPYVTGKAEYIGNDPLDPFNGENYRPGAGLDIKAGLGNSLNLNATINPDFGQVEVDPAIVNLSDVEYSFTEKRPFFTEGVNIFRFGNGGANNNVSFNWQAPNIFYSRRIGRAPQRFVDADYLYVPSGTHILGAGKISGRIAGDWKIGTVHALTQREMADVQIDGLRSQMEVEPLTYYGVLRMQRDFNSGAEGLGILTTYTNRFFNDASLENIVNKNAAAFAADGWAFLDDERTYVLTGWLAGSAVTGSKERITALQRSSQHYFQRPDAEYLGVDSNATSLAGYAGRIVLNKNRGRLSFNAALGALSPQFEINDLGYGSFSDLINMHFYTEYRWLDPTDYYLNASINGAVYSTYDFGWNHTGMGFRTGANIFLHDLSSAGVSFTYSPETYSARRTRGGPLTLNPVSRSFTSYYNSDNRKWWFLSLNLNGRTGMDYNFIEYKVSLEFKVNTALTLTVAPDFMKEVYNAQWITSYSDPAASNTYGRRYIFAKLNQTTLSTDIRADWILTPSLSIQVYIQPFIAAGKYSNFKNLQRSKSYDFNEYGKNGSSISTDGLEYQLDPDSDGPAAVRTISNPDFNYISLRGNAVLRWEYMPGSALYLVWTQSRQNIEPSGDFEFRNSFRDLVDIHPDNIFLVKLTYWFGM